MRSLKDEPDITSRSIEQQVKALFRDPLTELSQSKRKSKPFIFVVDALDECGDEVSRSRLGGSLCQILAFANWPKIFITSRPTNELIRKFSSTDTQILSINLDDTDAKKDV